MSTMDFERARMNLRPTHSHHQYAKSASNVPTYANRTVPSYYVANEESMGYGSNMASPRYSPHVQPWRKQQAKSSLSFLPSNSPRAEQQSEYTTAQQPRRPVHDAPPCISPFRSVRRMKQPFQLRLQNSPSFESLHSGRESRVPRPQSGHHTLRTWRSDQNLMTTSLETFGLLPSPPLSDAMTSQNSQQSPTSTYFSPKPGSESEYSQDTPKSCACEPPIKPREMAKSPNLGYKTETPQRHETTNVHLAHSNLIKQYESDNGKFTPVSPEPERMSSPAAMSEMDSIDSFAKRDFSGSSNATQRSRSGTVSSEGSWVPSNLSDCERWLQGAPPENPEPRSQNPRVLNRRKFQIFKPSDPDLKSSEPERKPKAPDEPVIFAVAQKTKPTKPKLVDISRQSSPAMSYGMPTPPTRTVPSTPDTRQEISAFSPDTPMELSDSGYITHHSGFSPSDCPDEKDEDDYTDASSLSSVSAEEEDEDEDEEEESDDDEPTIVCHKPTNTQEQRKLSPTPDLPPRIQSLPKPQLSPGRSSNMSEKEELEKWWDHEWTIDQLELSVKDFPRHMLRLTSPVIMFLRHNNERALIRPFRKIFPEVAENLLDGLCATLIARNYIVALAASNRRTSNYSQRPNLSRLDTVPEKISPSSTMQFNHPSPSRIRDRVLGTRSVELRQELDRIIDNLLFAISGRADDTLKAAVLVLAQVLEDNA